MVGLNVKEPETVCDDPNCPFHGTLAVRGQVLEGIVVSNKAERTITVERSFYKFIRKYERYEKRRSRISVHKPDCLDEYLEKAGLKEEKAESDDGNIQK